MSRTEALDLSRVWPARARSLLTVRAAISSERSSDRPSSSSLFLTCSYIRSHLLPFGTPLGGIASSSRRSTGGYPAVNERTALINARRAWSERTAALRLGARGAGGERPARLGGCSA